MPQRQSFDLQTYIRDIQTRPCFICEMVSGNPAYAHEIVYEDDVAIAFLNKYPPLYGYVLVAPRAHREQVTGDFTLDEYLALQQVIYRVAEAVRRVVKPERVYILSLGSQQGNQARPLAHRALAIRCAVRRAAVGSVAHERRLSATF